MNGEEIHVSDVRDIKNAFVFTELPYNYDQYKPTALHLMITFMEPWEAFA